MAGPGRAGAGEQDCRHSTAHRGWNNSAHYLHSATVGAGVGCGVEGEDGTGLTRVQGRQAAARLTGYREPGQPLPTLRGRVVTNNWAACDN